MCRPGLFVWPGPAGEVAWGPGMGEDWRQMKESVKKEKQKFYER